MWKGEGGLVYHVTVCLRRSECGRVIVHTGVSCDSVLEEG